MRQGIKIGPGNWRDKLDSGLHIAHPEVYFDLERHLHGGSEVHLENYRTRQGWLEQRP